MGAFFGIVTNDKDPVPGRGWVKCRCDLLTPYEDLLSGEDGWIPVSTLFTVPEDAGGTHHPLPIGSQVILLPIGGKPNNWVVVGSINSRVDQVSPEFDRSKGLVGEVHNGGITKITDLGARASIEAYPHGVVKAITESGAIVNQTEGGARSMLMADGNTILENPNATISISPAGDLLQSNTGGSQSKLTADGKVEIKNAFGGRVDLGEEKLQITGPADKISGLLDGVQKNLSGLLQQANGLVNQLMDAAKGLIKGANLDALFGQFEDIFGQLSKGIGSTFNQGLEKLKKLQGLDFKELLGSVTPHINQIVGQGLDQLVPQINKIITGATGDAQKIIDGLKGIIPADFKFDPDQLQKLIKGLGYNPEILTQGILNAIVPEGLGYLRSIFGMGLQGQLGQISNAVSLMPDFDLFGLNLSDLTSFYETKKKDLLKLIPGDLSIFLSETAIDDIVKNGGLDKLFAHFQKGFIDQALGAISKLSGGIGQIQEFRSLFDQLSKNNLAGFDPKTIESTLRSKIEGFAQQFQPLLESGIASLNQMVSSLPPKVGPIFELTDKVGRITAANGIGAKLEVAAEAAKLISPNGVSSVFADNGSAGFATPWGRFGFGAAGGEMLTKGKMLMSVLQEGGKVAGLELDPRNGAYLASYNDQKMPTAAIRVDEGNILLQNNNHGLAITPNGVFIENIHLSSYLGTISQRLAQLESLFPTTGG